MVESAMVGATHWEQRGEMTVEWTRDMQELATLWVDLLDNKVSPNQGLMVSPG
jgi:hypothetical protein